MFLTIKLFLAAVLGVLLTVAGISFASQPGYFMLIMLIVGIMCAFSYLEGVLNE